MVGGGRFILENIGDDACVAGAPIRQETNEENRRGNGHDEKFLEQSIFTTGLTIEATEQLGVFAREIWAQAFEKVVPKAETLVERDKSNPQATQRMRFGAYFYAEETQPQENESKPKHLRS